MSFFRQSRNNFTLQELIPLAKFVLLYTKLCFKICSTRENRNNSYHFDMNLHFQLQMHIQAHLSIKAWFLGIQRSGMYKRRIHVTVKVVSLHTVVP